MKRFYIIQEKVDYNQWFDLYSEELYQCKKMILVLKRKNPFKVYRLIKEYR